MDEGITIRTEDLLPCPERVVILPRVEVIIELALKEEVVIELAAIALVRVAESADSVADSLCSVGGVRYVFCELGDGELAALLVSLCGAANDRSMTGS